MDVDNTHLSHRRGEGEAQSDQRRPSAWQRTGRIAGVAGREIQRFAARPYPVARVLRPPLHVVRELGAAMGFWGLPPPPGPIVELGAGTGRLTKPLLDRGYQMRAVEPDRQAQRALAMLAEMFPGQLQVVEDVRDLDLPELVQAVVGADVLHHAPLSATLRQAVGLVAPGGILAFDEPDGAHPGWWAYVALTGRVSNEIGLAHATRTRITRALGEAGCVDIQWRRWAPPVRGLLGPRWFYLARRGVVG